MIGSFTLNCDMHVLPSRGGDIVKLLTVDLGLPIGIITPYHPEHPMNQRIPPDTLDQSTLDGTLAMLVNAGGLSEEISQLATIEGLQ
jgi:hypothetical protein